MARNNKGVLDTSVQQIRGYIIKHNDLQIVIVARAEINMTKRIHYPRKLVVPQIPVRADGRDEEHILHTPSMERCEQRPPHLLFIRHDHKCP